MVVAVVATVQGSAEPRRIQIVATGFTDPAPLLTNGGFESGTTGWTTTGTIVSTPLAPAEGVQYLKKTLAVGGAAVLASRVVTAPGGSTVITSAQVAGTDGGGTVMLRVTALDGGVAVSGITTSDSVVAADEWQTLETDPITLAAGDDAVRIELIGTPIGTPFDTYMDDVAATTVGSTGVATLYREDPDGVRSPVRGALSITPTGGALVLIDYEAPFGVPVTYVLAQTIAGVLVETVSNPVTITATLPWLTHPITGQGVAVTIETWPELAYAARQTLITVAGRAAPIAVTDTRLMASSELVALTRTRDQLRSLRELLATGDPILIRPVCGAVESQFAVIGDVTEARLKPTSGKYDQLKAGSDWRRRVTLAVQNIEQPAPQIRAIGDTLLDLHEYEPTDLDTLADAFGPGATLLTIATTEVGSA